MTPSTTSEYDLLSTSAGWNIACVRPNNHTAYRIPKKKANCSSRCATSLKENFLDLLVPLNSILKFSKSSKSEEIQHLYIVVIVSIHVFVRGTKRWPWINQNTALICVCIIKFIFSSLFSFLKIGHCFSLSFCYLKTSYWTLRTHHQTNRWSQMSLSVLMRALKTKGKPEVP